MTQSSFLRDGRGIGTVEFALIAPVFLAMLISVFQLGTLYFANADLRNAVAAGARHASIFPRPTTEAITQKISARVVKLDRSKVSGPTITYGKDANNYDFAQIEMRYTVPLNFIFFKTPAVTLVERRRVFLQPTV